MVIFKAAVTAIVAGFAVIALPEHASSNVVSKTRLVGAGDSVGGGSDLFLDLLVSPALTNDGDIVFYSTLDRSVPEVDTSNNTGLFYYDGASIRMIIREGDSAAGLSGVTYAPSTTQTNQLRVSRTGNVAVGTSTSDLGKTGAWHWDGNSPELYVYDGAPLNNGDVAVGNYLGIPRVTSSGITSVYVSLSNGELGLVFGPAGALEPRITVPNLTNYARASVRLNESNETAFIAISNPSNGVFKQGIRSDRSGGDVETLYEEDDLLPGLTGPVQISQFDDVSLAFNDLSQVAFLGTTVNGLDGIWAEQGGELNLVAMEGQPAPGGGIFDTLITLSQGPQGDVAFTALLEQGVDGVTSANNTGAWLWSDGTLKHLVREGDTPGGVTTSPFRAFGNPVVNALGQVAITSTFPDTDLWLYDPHLGLTLIESDVVFRDGVDQNGATKSPGLNDVGQLAYEKNDVIYLATVSSGAFPGDSDGDGDVDGDDLIAVQTNFGSVTPPPGDADGDGDVDGDDLIAVQTNFGAVASVAVPEPTSLGLVMTFMSFGIATARVSSVRHRLTPTH